MTDHHLRTISRDQNSEGQDLSTAAGVATRCAQLRTDDYERYGGHFRAPPSEAASRAIQVCLGALRAYGVVPRRLVASVVGGIGATLNRDCYLEAENDGELCAVLRGDPHRVFLVGTLLDVARIAEAVRGE